MRCCCLPMGLLCSFQVGRLVCFLLQKLSEEDGNCCVSVRNCKPAFLEQGYQLLLNLFLKDRWDFQQKVTLRGPRDTGLNEVTSVMPFTFFSLNEVFYWLKRRDA